MNRRKMGLSSLRAAAIDSLCRYATACIITPIHSTFSALKSALIVDHSSVQACLANISSKLYMVAAATDTYAVRVYPNALCEDFRDSVMVSENAIITLGKIGVAFVDMKSGSESIPELVLQVLCCSIERL